jgi:hypothetical protein
VTMKRHKTSTQLASRLMIALTLLMILPACLPTSMKLNSSGATSSSSTDSSTAPTGGGAADTPASAKVVLVQRGNMGDRKYIEGVFTEIFDSASYPTTGLHDRPGVEGAFNTTLKQPNVFGRACDVDSSSSAQDCAGDRLTATTAPPMAESSTVRQLNVFTICDIAINQANGPKAAAEKIGELTGGNLNEISSTNLPKIFTLFYRARDMSSDELNSYMTFNSTLKSRNLTVTERWQSILLMVCESPDWQIL